MKSVQASSRPVEAESRGAVDLKLEVVVIPVADVDRSKEFYGSSAEARRRLSVRQRLPGRPVHAAGSRSSIQFGTNITSAVPGSRHRAST
jgi:hypothetical protein